MHSLHVNHWMRALAQCQGLPSWCTVCMSTTGCELWHSVRACHHDAQFACQPLDASSGTVSGLAIMMHSLHVNHWMRALAQCQGLPSWCTVTCHPCTRTWFHFQQFCPVSRADLLHLKLYLVQRTDICPLLLLFVFCFFLLQHADPHWTLKKGWLYSLWKHRNVSPKSLLFVPNTISEHTLETLTSLVVHLQPVPSHRPSWSR